jgi:hypothetical protein
MLRICLNRYSGARGAPREPGRCLPFRLGPLTYYKGRYIYTYRPLDPVTNEIRLLSIPTGSNSVDKLSEPLRCSFEHVQSRLGFKLDERKSNDKDCSPW